MTLFFCSVCSGRTFVSANLFRGILGKLLEKLSAGGQRAVTYAEIIRRELRDRDREVTVLDIGCGTGLITGHIAKDLPQALVVGLDSYQWNIDYQTPEWVIKIERVQFCRADAHFLPFRTDSIDVVISFSLLEHLPEPGLHVHEIRRVLKRTGEAILEVPNLRYVVEPHTMVPFLWLMPRVVQSKILGVIDPSLNMRATVKWVLKLFQGSGFKEKKRIAIWHMGILRLLPIAPSYCFIFEKA